VLTEEVYVCSLSLDLIFHVRASLEYTLVNLLIPSRSVLNGIAKFKEQMMEERARRFFVVLMPQTQTKTGNTRSSIWR